MSDAKPRREPRNQTTLGADQSHAVHDPDISTNHSEAQKKIISLHHAGVRQSLGMGDLANQIRRGRLRKNLTQVQLAKRLHVNQSSVSQWESGTNSPDLERRVKLAATLGLPLQSLLPEAPSVLPEEAMRDPEVLRLVENFLKLTAEEQLSFSLLVEKLAAAHLPRR